MRRLLLALLLVGGLALPAFTIRPQPASADALHDFAAFIGCFIPGSCDPFGVADSCPIYQVQARVPQPGRHVYGYEEQCTAGSLGRFKVGASYDVASHEAQEKVTAVSGAWTVTATWSCPADPWSGHSGACRNTSGQVSMKGEITPGLQADWAKATLPFSARLLEDQYRPTLNGQLQNALRQTPDGAAPSPIKRLGKAKPPATPIKHLGKARPTSSWPVLRAGDESATVATLQYVLNTHDLDVTVDGGFGDETAAAVRAFQRRQGLAADAVVGEATWRALIVTLEQGDEGDAVAALQTQLAARDVDIEVDGDFGEQTAAAVRAFQRAHGLADDGVVGPQTWEALVSGR